MTPLSYARAGTLREAVGVTANDGARLLGGGTNLVDLMRKGIERPSRLVDVTGLAAGVEVTADGGLRIGAAARNSVVAAHPVVRRDFPMLSRAILAGASAQIRNMATVGGNLMQRTRCAYFQDIGISRCNKRSPGSGCDALEGFNRYNAILGASDACIAANPSDMCVALAALGATVQLAGPDGERSVPLTEFHRLTDERPDVDTVLTPGEVIVAVAVPPSPAAAGSTYRKVRDRASYAFALVSVAAGLKVEGGTIEDVAIAFGGVAPRPWRAVRAEDMLRGGPATTEAFAAAAAAELAAAVPREGNAFKIPLAQRTLVAVLEQLSGAAR